ncbi:hypothetical protein PJL15_00504 [Paenarthrobacter nitroguajacolicus]|nr:hypothetical protein [Paenarthrobacter nitroguajacolicus]
MQPGGGGASHLCEGRVGDVCCPGKLGRAKVCGLVAHPGDLVLRHSPQDGVGAFGHGLDDDEIAETLQKVLDEAPGIVSGLDDAVNRAENRGGIGNRDGIDDVVQQGGVRVTKKCYCEFVVQAVRARAGHELVQHGEGVADRTPACADDEREHAGSNRNVFLPAEQLEVLHERLRRNQPEGVVVRARADGPDDLVRLSGGKDELDVFRWLFDNLEQCVEAGRRDHVGLVNDEDLVAVPNRGEGGALAEITGVIDATVAGGVDLDDVQGSRSAACQFHTAGALAARGVGGAFRAVQAARQDARGGGFAAAARAGEEIGVVHAVLPERRHQRLRDVFLPDNVRERVRAIPSIQGSCNSHK